MMASFHRNSFKRGETRGSTKLLVTVVISLFLLTALAYLLCSRGNTPLWQRCFPGEHADNSTKKSVTYRTPPLFSPPLPQATKNESSTPSPLSSPNAIAITTAGPNVDGSDQTNNRLVQIIQKNFSDQLAKVAMLRLPEPKPEPKKKAKPARPIQFEKRTIDHVSFYQTTIDLNDPEMFIEIGLANNTEQANTQTVTFGDEHFASMLKRYPAAVVANGTFFAKDKFECIMGNMVSSGQRLKYSQWENYGTTLGLKAGNIPEMVTACEQGQPDWDSHWLSITCGPRLLKDGLVWLL